jgi:hypothetical protein
VRSEDLEAAARQSSFIGDAVAYPEYTQAKVFTEINDKLQTAFEDIVVKARAGYWLHEFVFTTTTAARYRIPPRAVVGGLEKVEISAGGTNPFIKLSEIPQSIIQDYEGNAPSYPYVFTVQGDQVEIVPAPTAGMVLRMTYYIRPSRLVISQSSTQIGSGVDRGRVTGVNTSTRVVTVNALPFDYSLAVPAAITTATQTVDIVHPDGWHELSLVGATQTLSGLNITIGGTDSLGDVQLGDYVRVADQTDWPCLPDDFHRCLADTAAIKILLEIHLLEKAEALTATNGFDIARLRSLLLPRVKAEPKQIGILRRSRGWGYPGWRLS